MSALVSLLPQGIDPPIAIILIAASAFTSTLIVAFGVVIALLGMIVGATGPLVSVLFAQFFCQ